mmetsp:Transcript_85670/g.239377  ORF Transcript_85670/g.239377 Transcript_85670/m.239377 type:complete len:419 (-) Transcript_85670:82-1338(-)
MSVTTISYKAKPGSPAVGLAQAKPRCILRCEAAPRLGGHLVLQQGLCHPLRHARIPHVPPVARPRVAQHLLPPRGRVEEGPDVGSPLHLPDRSSGAMAGDAERERAREEEARDQDRDVGCPHRWCVRVLLAEVEAQEERTAKHVASYPRTSQQLRVPIQVLDPIVPPHEVVRVHTHRDHDSLLLAGSGDVLALVTGTAPSTRSERTAGARSCVDLLAPPTSTQRRPEAWQPSRRLLRLGRHPCGLLGLVAVLACLGRHDPGIHPVVALHEVDDTGSALQEAKHGPERAHERQRSATNVTKSPELIHIAPNVLGEGAFNGETEAEAERERDDQEVRVEVPLVLLEDILKVLSDVVENIDPDLPDLQVVVDLVPMEVVAVVKLAEGGLQHVEARRKDAGEGAAPLDQRHPGGRSMAAPQA